MFHNLNFLYNFAIAFLVCVLTIPIIIKSALKLKIVDAPDGKLKVHEKVTPYLGGVAIWATIIILTLFILSYSYNTLIFLTSISLLMLLGLIDDMFVISPLQKFLGQICALLILIFSNFYNQNLFLSLFWSLSIINAFNLIDVMDGLCATSAIGSTFMFLLISVALQQYYLASLLCLFLGALVAFLVYNFPPAKIYLGDAGSMFIGGFLGTVPFLIKWPSLVTALLCSCAILLIPILELVSLIIIRTYKKIPFYLGSPDHFCIYLKIKGWSKTKILSYVAFFNMIIACVVMLHIFNHLSVINLTLLLCAIITCWFLCLFKL